MYYAVPKMNLAVYMVARITDLGDLNIVPGTDNLFHDGAYLGKTYINRSTINDTLDLSLGKDPNLIVKRTLLKNNSKEKINGDKIVKTVAYRIEIKNHKSRTIKLIVQDQIPISRKKEIEVKFDEISKGKVDELLGIVSWRAKMKASSTITYDITYTISYDKNQRINLANF